MNIFSLGLSWILGKVPMPANRIAALQTGTAIGLFEGIVTSIPDIDDGDGMTTAEAAELMFSIAVSAVVGAHLGFVGVGVLGTL
ncbi:hypothetical protein [Halovulum sp. GXIMD14793]